MVADRPHLGGLRQQLVQVAPPTGRVQRVAVLTGGGIVEDVFDARPHPLGGLGLADPERGQDLQDVLGGDGVPPLPVRPQGTLLFGSGVLIEGITSVCYLFT